MNTPAEIEWKGDNPQLKSLSFAAYFLAAVLFLLSLFLPAFITQTQDIDGYWVLAMGWLGFITFQFAWYALPLAIIAIRVSARKPQLSLLLAVFAILVASEAFLFKEIPFSKSEEVIDLGLGFYLWYMSFMLVAGGTLFRLAAWGSHVEDIIEDEKDQELISPPAEPLRVRKQRTAERKLIQEPKPHAIVLPQSLPDTPKGVLGIPPPLPISAKALEQWKYTVPPPLPGERR